MTSGMALRNNSEARADYCIEANDLIQLIRRFRRVRATTESLCAGLEPEDTQLQPVPEVSPPKWHLAHTSWFFEEFVIGPVLSDRGYRPFDSAYSYLFNSYYEGVGRRHPREQRGLLSRPSLREVLRYRDHVTTFVEEALSEAQRFGSLERLNEVLRAIELGIQHEEQHQELLVTDIKFIFWSNPLKPVYRHSAHAGAHVEAQHPAWLSFEGGDVHVGAGDISRFAFDNERPRHAQKLASYRLANRAVTNGEFLEFIASGGYHEPKHWLSDGWETVRRDGWQAPLYWESEGEKSWREFTLEGYRSVDPAAPVCHISFYEADAFARWRGSRLPLEAEWEHAARALEGQGLAWEWTASPYVAYPGFRPLEGIFGEYNGKFMCNQMVLRGGSSATPQGHIRSSYRNFFPPSARWQFSGLRLAQSVELS
jgi:ergothioneine biosynthesis protein EgtB